MIHFGAIHSPGIDFFHFLCDLAKKIASAWMNITAYVRLDIGAFSPPNCNTDPFFRRLRKFPCGGRRYAKIAEEDQILCATLLFCLVNRSEFVSSTFIMRTWGICTRRAGKFNWAGSRLYSKPILSNNIKYSLESSLEIASVYHAWHGSLSSVKTTARRCDSRDLCLACHKYE